MPALQIVSSRPLAGKTAIVVALGQAFAQQAPRVQLLRAGSGAAAEADATTFATFLFAGSPGRPVEASVALSTLAAEQTAIIELDAGATPLAGRQAIVVVRGTPDEADASLASSLGDRLLGTIATRVPLGDTEAIARRLTDGGLRPLALLPEDRALAAPSVDEIHGVLAAELLYDGENGAEVVEDVLIAPIYADPAQPHFRRFASKAVLSPFNKTDLHLAAIETQAACLVITGGGKPSPYVLDRAQGESTTVLLAESETPETLAALSDVWLTSRFRGERKASAALALLESRLDVASILERIG
jgi:BioD-like phosphotransacetylase family protein